MNDAWGYEDNANQPEHNDGPKALREAYAALKKQNEELAATVTGFIADQKKQKLSTVFESLGVPGALDVYQGEPDPDKAREWAESMKATFGGAQGVTAPAPATEAAPAMTPEQQQQFQTMNEAGQSGTPMGNMQAAEAAIGAATSLEDLIRISAQTQHMR